MIQRIGSDILLIGVGNDWRSDDGIGLEVGRRIKDLGLPGVHVVFENRDGISLEIVWRGWDQVIVVDAMCSGAKPGDIVRIHANHTPLKPGAFPQSVHAYGLAEAVELARVLDEMPTCLVIYGVEGRDFAHGNSITPVVDEAGERVTARIMEEIEHLQTQTGEPPDA